MSVGMVIMRPTTIVVAGGGTETASIRAAGGVEFANATSLSLNGVFTSDYDDYMIVMRGNGNTNMDLRCRLRSSGSDATGANYTKQQLTVNGTSVAAARITSNTDMDIGVFTATVRDGNTIWFYGPGLAQPTAVRSISVNGLSSAYLIDEACTHSLSVAYDGFTFYPSSGEMTGLVTVYGYAQ